MLEVETRQTYTEIPPTLLSHLRIQQQFDSTFGRGFDADDLLHRSYNPVSDRWNIERLRVKGDIEGEQSLIKEIRRNWEKNLRERLRVAESVIRYKRLDGRLYSELFPNEPFRDVIIRGAQIRLMLYGSPEPEREGERGELGGWDKVEDIKPGEVKTVISPHGVASKTAFHGEFVDKYEADDNGVTLTRSAVEFDYRDYEREALKLNPDFFADYDNRPLDAWYLSHPLEGVIQNLKLKGMSNEEFMSIYLSPMVQVFIDYYIERITDKVVDWEEVQDTINAILNQVDNEKDGVGGQTLHPDLIRLRIRELGRKTPRKVMGGGCPTNQGYENSVAKFLENSECKCPGGNPDNHYHCPGCGKKYADETHKHERTKECSCGFQFNC